MSFSFVNAVFIFMNGLFIFVNGLFFPVILVFFKKKSRPPSIFENPFVY